jgi:hypothetical protein
MTADRSNLEKTELVIAKILSVLMENGLKESTLVFRTLDLSDDYEPFFKTCFLWLIDEGLVRSRTNILSIGSAFHAYDPVLTAKGFAVLGSKLLFKDGQVALASVVEDKATDSGMYTGIGDFLGGLLGGYTKSIGS